MGMVWCDGCGNIRWTLRAKPGAAAPETCEICGGALKPERRRPGRRFSRNPERRDFRAPRKPLVPPAA